jgi:hypothetical protein
LGGKVEGVIYVVPDFGRGTTLRAKWHPQLDEL